MISFSYPVG